MVQLDQNYRQIMKLKPNKLILYENNEFALYKITSELSELNKGFKKGIKNVQIFSILGSVNDAKLVDHTI